MEQNIFKYFNPFWDWIDKNESKVDTTSIAIFCFMLHVTNKLNWRESFTISSTEVMNAIGIKSYKTYKKGFDFLVENNLIEVIEYAKNQYSCNRIALVKNTKALTKAFPKHVPKQVQSISHIHKTIKDIKDIKNNIPSENFDFEPTKKKQPKQPKIQKHIFADSVFHENEPYFETEWMKTESFKSNPLLSIKKIFNTLRLSDEKYKYVNWIKAAENWVLRNPSQYHVSVKDLVQADPMAAFMNKGELQSAESTLKRQIKRTLLNGNQPNTDEYERELPFD